MKLSDTIQYINTALNYPALTYIDIQLYFDMAIAELNTTLHTSIPLVKDMVEEFRQKMSKPEPNKVILTSDPADDEFLIPTDPVDPLENEVDFYYSTETRKYYLLNKYTEEYVEYDSLKAIYITSEKIHTYQSIAYGGVAAWAETQPEAMFEADLGDYLPNDWVLLWLIPYVCYNYSVRDGGTAQTFAESLTQGFQQLQETYSVPDKVILATYADKPAYTKIVEAKLPNLNILVPTRAIYEDMKHSRNTNAIYGSFYDRGGF